MPPPGELFDHTGIPLRCFLSPATIQDWGRTVLMDGWVVRQWWCDIVKCHFHHIKPFPDLSVSCVVNDIINPAGSWFMINFSFCLGRDSLKQLIGKLLVNSHACTCIIITIFHFPFTCSFVRFRWDFDMHIFGFSKWWGSSFSHFLHMLLALLVCFLESR